MDINVTLFEHRFWLQILGDHSRFIYYSLAPTQTQEIEKAKQFIAAFDKLLEDARRQLTEAEVEELNRMALESTYELRKFKLNLLTLTLHSKIKIHMSSTFFNHMLNELDEYLLTIKALISNQNPVFHPLHYHLLWLSDGVGHAAGIMSNLDEVERDLLKKSREYEKTFNDLYSKSIELNGYMRTGLTTFPALGRLNQQAVTAMTPFKEFLESLRDQRMDGRVLGTLLPLMADHMAREECYYLTKLSQSAPNIAKPDCNPAKPRIEA